MSSFTHFIERDDQEIAVEVEYTYSRGSRGHCDRYGAPEEPDDDPEVEVQSVTGPDGKEMVLTPDEEKKIEEACWEDLNAV